MSNNVKEFLNDVDREADSFSGHFGLAAQRIDSDSPLLFQADTVFPTASVIKLAVLAEYFAQVASGELTPERPVELQDADKIGGSGVLKDLQPGLRLTLADIATLAITVSDNTAANLLIEQVGGLEPINARLKALGMDRTTMARPFVFDFTVDNTGTPADFLRLLLAVTRQQLITPAISRQMLELMGRQQFMQFIPRYLPFHPYAADYGLPQTVSIANKVGMLPGTINDAAIITTPSVTYALVIFTRDCLDPRPDPDNEAALLVARLSKRVYDTVMNEAA